jgi:hypothetical protein
LGAPGPGSADDKSGSADDKSGSADDRPGSRFPNSPGRLTSFGAPNDGPVPGMHFGGLVRPVTEFEYLGPDIDDSSFRIRF